MINHGALIKAGYRFFGIYGMPLYQKIILVGTQKLYWIEIHVLDSSGVQIVNPIELDHHRRRAVAQLYTNEVWDSEHCTEIGFPIPENMTLEQLEAFYARAYTSMGCIPDPRNN